MWRIYFFLHLCPGPGFYLLLGRETDTKSRFRQDPSPCPITQNRRSAAQKNTAPVGRGICFEVA